MPTIPNPKIFVQPFLELTLAGTASKSLSSEGVMFIDVGGRIDDFITDKNEPTELLVRLCKRIAKAGAVVTSFQRYAGSGGASHMLRGDALFARMATIDQPPKETLAYEYRVPVYRGP
jgi:hypothetical protein